MTIWRPGDSLGATYTDASLRWAPDQSLRRVRSTPSGYAGGEEVLMRSAVPQLADDHCSIPIVTGPETQKTASGLDLCETLSRRRSAGYSAAVTVTPPLSLAAT